jgi:CubicO group peptidase (beta-lactamase class C family)
MHITYGAAGIPVPGAQPRLASWTEYIGTRAGGQRQWRLASPRLGWTGMRDTGFWATQTSRLATSGRPTPRGLTVFDQPDGMRGRPPAFGNAAAGLVSTARDLLAVARMLLAHGSPTRPARAARAMTTGQLTARQRARGGFGPDFFASQSWSYCQLVQDSGAFGWDGGLGTTWQVEPRYDLTVIILTQRMFDSPDRPAAHAAIVAAAYDALAGRL